MKSHPESTTAALTDNEPPDGTKLVVIGEHTSKVIWRDDAAARSFDALNGEHWFDNHDEDPMVLHEHVKYADAVYALGEPLATFHRAGQSS